MLKDSGDIESKYYLRFTVEDKPGVFAKITKILGDNDVSIAAVSQKGKSQEYVPIIILTHNTLERNIKKSIDECNNLDIVKEKTILIRIEEFE